MYEQKLTGKLKKRKSSNSKTLRKTKKGVNSDTEEIPEKKPKLKKTEDKLIRQEKIIPSFGNKEKKLATSVSKRRSVTKGKQFSIDDLKSKESESDKQNENQSDIIQKETEPRPNSSSSELPYLKESADLSVELNHVKDAGVSATSKCEETDTLPEIFTEVSNISSSVGITAVTKNIMNETENPNQSELISDSINPCINLNSVQQDIKETEDSDKTKLTINQSNNNSSVEGNENKNLDETELISDILNPVKNENLLQNLPDENISDTLNLDQHEGSETINLNSVQQEIKVTENSNKTKLTLNQSNNNSSAENENLFQNLPDENISDTLNLVQHEGSETMKSFQIELSSDIFSPGSNQNVIQAEIYETEKSHQSEKLAVQQEEKEPEISQQTEITKNTSSQFQQEGSETEKSFQTELISNTLNTDINQIVVHQVGNEPKTLLQTEINSGVLNSGIDLQLVQKEESQKEKELKTEINFITPNSVEQKKIETENLQQTKQNSDTLNTSIHLKTDQQKGNEDEIISYTLNAGSNHNPVQYETSEIERLCDISDALNPGKEQNSIQQKGNKIENLPKTSDTLNSDNNFVYHERNETEKLHQTEFTLTPDINQSMVQQKGSEIEQITHSELTSNNLTSVQQEDSEIKMLLHTDLTSVCQQECFETPSTNVNIIQTPVQDNNERKTQPLLDSDTCYNLLPTNKEVNLAITMDAHSNLEEKEMKEEESEKFLKFLSTSQIDNIKDQRKDIQSKKTNTISKVVTHEDKNQANDVHWSEKYPVAPHHPQRDYQTKIESNDTVRATHQKDKEKTIHSQVMENNVIAPSVEKEKNLHMNNSKQETVPDKCNSENKQPTVLTENVSFSPINKLTDKDKEKMSNSDIVMIKENDQAIVRSPIPLTESKMMDISSVFIKPDNHEDNTEKHRNLNSETKKLFTQELDNKMQIGYQECIQTKDIIKCSNDVDCENNKNDDNFVKHKEQRLTNIIKKENIKVTKVSDNYCCPSDSFGKENKDISGNISIQLINPFPQLETNENVRNPSVQTKPENKCDKEIIMESKHYLKTDKTEISVPASSVYHVDQKIINSEKMTKEYLSAPGTSCVFESTKVQEVPNVMFDTDLSDSQLCQIDLEESQSLLKSITLQRKKAEEGEKVVQNLINDMQYLNKLLLKTKREVEMANKKKQSQHAENWKSKK